MKYNKGFKGKGEVLKSQLNKNVFQCCCDKSKEIQDIKKNSPKG